MKQITGIGKNELPNNRDELLALIKEEDVQKLSIKLIVVNTKPSVR
ncbi:hypothetical protein [Petrotoga sibirica]|nr:hypothetical protein [Petrotoga sibirica]